MDFTGCTEFLIYGWAVCTNTFNITSSVGYLVSSALRNGNNFISALYEDIGVGVSGFMCKHCIYKAGGTAITDDTFNTVGNGIDHKDKKISNITWIAISAGAGGVTSAELKIYAR